MFSSSSRMAVLAVLLVCLFPASLQASPRDLVLKGAASPTPGEHRVALVIGNTHYGGVNELKNPENDAEAMAHTLQGLGFTVTQLLDADRMTLRDSVHEFRNAIARSGSNTVALLYYSGHGMQVGGKNYLIPIGFQPPSDQEDIDDYAYPMQKALDEMQAASAQINIVILDACRSNPYGGTRAWGGRGLAKIESAEGVYVCYATAEGKTADDNTDGTNGLYTQELLKNIKTPGLDIDEVFRRTRKAVKELSRGEQFPYVYDGLTDDFYFAGASGKAPLVVPFPVPSPPIVADPAIDTAKPLCDQNGVDIHQADAVNRLGLAYYAKNDNESADTLFAAAVALAPSEALYRLNHAGALLNLNRWDDAKSEDRKAIDLGWHDPHWTFGYFGISPQ